MDENVDHVQDIDVGNDNDKVVILRNNQEETIGDSKTQENTNQDVDKENGNDLSTADDNQEERIVAGHNDGDNDNDRNQSESTDTCEAKDIKEVIEDKNKSEIEIVGSMHGIPDHGAGGDGVDNVGVKTEDLMQEKTEDDSLAKEEMKGDFRNPQLLDSNGRSQLYERGRQYDQKSMKDHALNCYLGCLTGLNEDNQFSNLPQCLHQIADIYFEKEEYEKAVHFIQAEKMYYETALVDITELQKQLKERQDEMGGGDADSQPDPHANKPEILKAKEFDNLSRMCLQQGNTQLALEYCGKATKIRQAVYGENHPETIKSLDLFTVIYADVGKKQYADAMKKFGIGESEDKEDSNVTGNKGSEESGLRYRGSQHKTEDSEVRQDNDSVPQEEYEPTSPEQERADDFVMTLLMMMVFFLITVFFALVMTYMYCHYAPKSEMCASIRSEVNYFYMRLKYHYYYYFKSNKGSTYM